MKKLNEDYTMGVLQGIPIFCINRFYIVREAEQHFKKAHYIFEFENGYSASVVEFIDKDISRGHQYEILSKGLDDGNDNIDRGDGVYIHKLLCQLESMVALKT